MSKNTSNVDVAGLGLRAHSPSTLSERNAGGFGEEAESGASWLLVTSGPHRSPPAMGLVTLLYSILCGSVTWKPLFTQTRMGVYMHACTHMYACLCAHTRAAFAYVLKVRGERGRVCCSHRSSHARRDWTASLAAASGLWGHQAAPAHLLSPGVGPFRPLAFPVWPGRGVFLSQGSCIRERKSILSSWDGTCYVSPAGKPRCPMRHLLGDPGGHVAPPASRHPQVESHRASLNLFSLRTDHGPRRPGPATCVTSASLLSSHSCPRAVLASCRAHVAGGTVLGAVPHQAVWLQAGFQA